MAIADEVAKTLKKRSYAVFIGNTFEYDISDKVLSLNINKRYNGDTYLLTEIQPDEADIVVNNADSFFNKLELENMPIRIFAGYNDTVIERFNGFLRKGGYSVRTKQYSLTAESRLTIFKKEILNKETLENVTVNEILTRCCVEVGLSSSDYELQNTNNPLIPILDLSAYKTWNEVLKPLLESNLAVIMYSNGKFIVRDFYSNTSPSQYTFTVDNISDFKNEFNKDFVKNVLTIKSNYLSKGLNKDKLSEPYPTNSDVANELGTVDVYQDDEGVTHRNRVRVKKYPLYKEYDENGNPTWTNYTSVVYANGSNVGRKIALVDIDPLNGYIYFDNDVPADTILLLNYKWLSTAILPNEIKEYIIETIEKCMNVEVLVAGYTDLLIRTSNDQISGAKVPYSSVPDIPDTINLQVFEKLEDKKFRIKLKNSCTDPVVMSTLMLWGNIVKSYNPIEVKYTHNTSVDKYGRKELEIGNDFIISAEQATSIINFLHNSMSDAIYSLSLPSTSLLPHVELGKCTVIESSTNTNGDYLITQMSDSMQDNQWSSSVTCIPYPSIANIQPPSTGGNGTDPLPNPYFIDKKPEPLLNMTVYYMPNATAPNDVCDIAFTWNYTEKQDNPISGFMFNLDISEADNTYIFDASKGVTFTVNSTVRGIVLKNMPLKESAGLADYFKYYGASIRPYRIVDTSIPNNESGYLYGDIQYFTSRYSRIDSFQLYNGSSRIEDSVNGGIATTEVTVISKLVKSIEHGRVYESNLLFEESTGIKLVRDGKVKIHWGQVEAGVYGQRIYGNDGTTVLVDFVDDATLLDHSVQVRNPDGSITTIGAIADTIPPAFTSTPQVVNNADGTAKINWLKPIDNDLFMINIWRNTTNNSGTATLAYSTTNLETNEYYDDCGVGTFHYWLSAVDKSNNECPKIATNPSNVTVTDTMLPNPPNGFSVSGGWGRIDISFIAPSDKDVLKYKVLASDTNSDTAFASATIYYTGTTSFTEFNRNTTNPRYYRIYSIDKNNNTSATYLAGNGTALLAGDNSAPNAPTGDGNVPDLDGRITITFAGSTSNDADTYRIIRHTCTASNRTGDDNGLEIGLIKHMGSGVQHNYIDSYLKKDKYYYYEVYCIDNSGMQSTSSLKIPSIGGTIQAVDTTPPSVPTINDTHPMVGAIRIGWNSVTSAVSYKVFRYDTNSIETFLGSTTALIWIDNSPETDVATTYSYKVSAVDSWGNESAKSVSTGNLTSLTLNIMNDVTKPTAGTTSTTPINDGSIKVSWLGFADSESGIGGFNIWRATTSAGANQIILGTISTNLQSSFIDYTTVHNNTYYYWVTCFDNAGNETDLPTSGWVSGTSNDTRVPTWPVSSVPTAVARLGKIDITWPSSDSNDVVSYAVEESTNSGSTYYNIATVNTNSYTKYNVTNTKAEISSFRYRVKAKDTAGLESAYIVSSAPDTSVYTPADGSAPTTPTGLSPSSDNEGRITLTWSTTGISADTRAYRIYRSTDNTNFTMIGETVSAQWVDAYLVPLTTYYYKLSAVDWSGMESALSASVSKQAVDTTAPTPPNPSGQVGVGQIKITWTEVAEAGTTIEVWRCNGTTWIDASAIKVATVASSGGGGQGVYFDNDPPSNSPTAYSYKLKIRDKWGNVSGFSTNFWSGTTFMENGNLLNNTSLTGTITSWTGGTSLVVENVSFNGVSIPCQKVSTNADVVVLSDYINIDPSKAYEINMWFQSDVATGTNYMGIYCYDSSNTQLVAETIDCNGSATVTSTNNPYFWNGDNLPTNTWIKRTGYILPKNFDSVQSTLLGQNILRNIRIPSNTAKIRVRWLNFNSSPTYGSGTTSTTWVAYPSLMSTVDSVLSLVANAKSTADSAITNASTAQTTANTAIGQISDMGNSNKLTASEKIVVKKEWDIIQAEKPTLDTQADTYSVTTEKTAYGTSYTTLSSFLTPVLTDMSTTSDIVGTTMVNDFKDYYAKRLALLNKISSNIQTLANTANTNANTAINQISDMGNASKLTPPEKLTVKREFDIITNEKTTYDNQATAYSITTEKTDYDNAYSTLSTYLSPLLLSMNTTSDITGTTLTTNFSNYYSKRAILLNKISDKIDSLADTANTNANTANSAITEMASDSKLSPSEKQATKKEWDIIQAEKPTIEAQATTYGITTEKTNFVNSYNTLNTYITPLLSVLTTTSDIVGDTFRLNFKDYYDKKTILLRVISEKAKTLADNAQSTVDNLQLGGRNWWANTKIGSYSNGVINTKSANITLSNYKITVSGNPSDLVGNTISTFKPNLTITGKTNLTTVNMYYKFDNGTQQSQNLTVTNGAFNYILPVLAGATYVNIGLGQYPYVSSYWLDSVKIENGNQASDWTPAPEDVDNAIATAQSTANTANQAFLDMTNDNKLTADEKQSTKKEWDCIVAEKPTIVSQATTYSISTTNFTSAYDTLNTYITPLLSDLTSTSDITGTTFRTNFKNYYDQKAQLLKAISDKAKGLVDGISVGGRNLVLGTGIPSSVVGANITNQTKNIYNFAGGDSSATIGQQITCTFDWAISGTTTPTGTFWFQGSNPYPQLSPVVTLSSSNTSGHIKYTLTIASGSTPFTSVNLRMDNLPTIATLTISKLQIELGNVPSSWTPAPEDVDAQIADANKNAQDAIDATNAMSDDNQISPLEKQLVKKEMDIITSEKILNDTQADALGVSRTAYDNAYTTLNTYISPFLSDLTTTQTIVGTNFRTNFKTYYDARTNLLNAISSKLNSNIANVQIGGRNFLKKTNPSSGTPNMGGTVGTGVICSLGLIAETGSPSGQAVQLVRSDGTTTQGGRYWSTNHLTNGQIYTWSLYAKGTGTWRVGHEESGQTNITLTSTYTKYTYTFTAVTGTYYQFTFYATGTGAGTAEIDFYNLKLEEGNRATTWTPAPEDIQFQLDDLNNSGRLVPSEKADLKLQWDIIIYEESTLASQADTYGITTEKTAYVTAYNTLSSFLSPLFADMTVTSDVNRTTMTANFTDYFNKKLALLNKISAVVKASADQANTDIANMALDSKLSPVEKQTLKTLWDAIFVEKPSLDIQADNYGLSTAKSNYDSDFTALSNFITNNNIFTDMTATTDVNTSDLRTYFTNYYSEKVTLLNLIADEAKKIANSALSMDLVMFNPNFSDWTSTYPTGWDIYSTSPPPSKTTTPISPNYGNCVEYNITTATTNAGMQSTNALWKTGISNMPYVTITLDFYLKSGVLDGAGLLLDWAGMGSPNRLVLALKDEITSPTLSKWYTVKKTFKRPNDTVTGWTGYNSWIMANYNQLGTLSVKDIVFGRVEIRSASQSEIDSYNNQKALADIASDNKLTPVEKQSIKVQFDSINSEKIVYDTQALVYKVSTTAYDNAFQTLSSYLTPLLTDLTTTSDITGSTFRTNFNNYYTEKNNLIKGLQDAGSSITDNVFGVDNRTDYLFHFDGDANSTNGVKPESTSVNYTLRPYEGKYGGAVGMDMASTNLLAIDANAWNISKSNYQGTCTVTSNGKDLITSARFDFKPRLDPLTGGWQVAEYTKSVPAYRTDNSKYTLSFLVRSFTPQYPLSISIMQGNGLNPVMNTASCTFTDTKWKLFETTFLPLNAGNGTQIIYIVANENASFEVANPQIENLDCATSFRQGTVGDSYLDYRVNIAGDFTFSFWFSPNYEWQKGFTGSAFSRNIAQLYNSDTGAYLLLADYISSSTATNPFLGLEPDTYWDGGLTHHYHWGATAGWNVKKDWYYYTLIKQGNDLSQIVYKADGTKILDRKDTYNGTSSKLQDFKFNRLIFYGAYIYLLDEVLLKPVAVNPIDLGEIVKRDRPSYDLYNTHTIIDGSRIQSGVIEGVVFKVGGINGQFGELQVYDGSGNKVGSFGSTANLQSTLNASNIYATNLYDVNTTPRSYYINPQTGNDSNSGTSSASPKQSFANVMSLLGNSKILNNVTINIYLSGTFNERLRITNFSGYGYIIIYAQNAVINGGIDIYGNTCMIYIIGTDNVSNQFKIYGNSTTLPCIKAEQNLFVRIDNMYINNQQMFDDAVTLRYGHYLLNNGQITNSKKYAINFYGAVGNVTSVKGTSDIGTIAQVGSVVTMTNACPAGVTYNAVTSTGSSFVTTGTYTGGDWGGVGSPTWSHTFYGTGTSTYSISRGYWWGVGSSNNEMMQGGWDGTDQAGCFWIQLTGDDYFYPGTAGGLRNRIKAEANIVSATITFPSQDTITYANYVQYDYSTKYVPLTLVGITNTGAGGGYGQYANYGVIGTSSFGSTEYNLPLQAVKDLWAGRINGLAIRGAGNSNWVIYQGYSSAYQINNPYINVTYKQNLEY